jgi:hypothetical protein
MDKVQNKPHGSVHHTPSSESFKVYPDGLIHNRAEFSKESYATKGDAFQ